MTDEPSPEAIAILKKLTSLTHGFHAPDKDIDSHQAFQLAGQLIGPLLKWAINHEAGKIIGNIPSHVGWGIEARGVLA